MATSPGYPAIEIEELLESMGLRLGMELDEEILAELAERGVVAPPRIEGQRGRACSFLWRTWPRRAPKWRCQT